MHFSPHSLYFATLFGTLNSIHHVYSIHLFSIESVDKGITLISKKVSPILFFLLCYDLNACSLVYSKEDIWRWWYPFFYSSIIGITYPSLPSLTYLWLGSDSEEVLSINLGPCLYSQVSIQRTRISGQNGAD